MKYDRNLVATIIENEFWDDLYNEIDDSVMNMEGQELDEAFETYVDYAELDQIENVNPGLSKRCTAIIRRRIPTCGAAMPTPVFCGSCTVASILRRRTA